MAMNMTAAVNIKANVDGLASIAGLQKGLKGVEDQAGRTGGAFGRLRGLAGNALGALQTIAPAATVAGLAAVAKRTLDSAAALSDLSQRTGVAVPALARFSKAAQLSDTSLESVGKSLVKLSRAMNNVAQGGAGPAANAFNQLGIKVTDAQGKLKSADAVFLEIADKFNKLPDGAQKAALAVDLFGKSGAELIPLLNMGSKEIENFGTKMTQEFADRAEAFGDRLDILGQKAGGLAASFTIALLPALEKIVAAIEPLLDRFLKLPERTQAIIGGITLLVTSLGVLLPIIGGIVSVVGSLIGGFLAIPAAIAGWLGAIGPLIASLGAFGQVIVGVFTGPAGWITLLVLAGAAIYTFRDQVGAAFAAIGKFFSDAARGFYLVFVEPIIKAGQFAYSKLLELFGNLANALRAPFEAVGRMIRGVVNGILNGIGSAMRSVINAINYLIQGANFALSRLRLPSIPYLPVPQIPQFAAGGVVGQPTLAVVGEGGEREYIIPESKMARASANYMAGARGASVIPAFANGGVVGPGSATVNIQTGPVLQQQGERYVTVADLERALQTMAVTLLTNNRSAGGRRFAGIG